jgi:arylsulfatase A-like enzyme
MDTLRRVTIVPLALLIAGALTGPTVFGGPPPRRHVLFIASDDLRPELGCYGNPLMRTPHLDALAASSVRFDRAYCQYPLCNPSRTSMLTGRHPTTTGVLDNRRWFRAEHPDVVTLPQHFQAHGYVTARVGKIFHGGIDDTDAWTIGGEPRKFTGAVREGPGQDPKLSDRIVVLEGEGESHADHKTATRAIELLERFRGEDRPFFLAVGFLKPHSPPTAPRAEFAKYDPAQMLLPPDFASPPTVPPGFPTPSVPPRSSDLFIGRDASPEAAREMIRAYYASATFVDTQVGRVLAALDRLGLRDQTIIVFWGDHGYHLGEKGKWSKHNSLFEVGTRVPLTIAAPGLAGNSQVSPRTVQLLDVYPTLVELCGLPMPPGLEGHSLVPLLQNPAAPWEHPAHSVTQMGKVLGETIRTERWRFTQWDGGESGILLFDEQNDPHEMTNLANDPARADTIRALRHQLSQRGK